MRGLLLLPVALDPGSAAAAASPAVLPGDGFQVERYALALRPDLASGAVSGDETVIVRSLSDRLTRIAFSGNALHVDGATANGAAIAVVAERDAIVFLLPRPLPKGRAVTLRFRVAGLPARGVTATAGGLYTSYFACDWMVCLQDAPGDKAAFALDLFLPAGMTSLGIGRARPVRAAGDGLMRHRWRSTRAYSPYLYAFAAGPFPRRSERTPQGRLVYVDATGARADLPRLFARTPAIAAFLAEKAGRALPDRRYAQVLAPGDEAQEAAGFSLIGADALAREAGDPAAEWIVAHEMAHQWWGNLVTCATWRDFWLNEGVVTFLVAAWKERRLGPAAYREELAIAQRRLERARQAGFDKPLAWDGRYPSLGLRRAVQYGKGALFLARLRDAMGDAAFWRGLRRFTRRHAGGTVTSRDLEAAMQATSDRDLAPLFVEWVYGVDDARARSKPSRVR